jgi:hypothetical protein
MPSTQNQFGPRIFSTKATSAETAQLDILQFIGEALAGIEWQAQQTNSTLTKIALLLQAQKSP